MIPPARAGRKGSAGEALPPGPRLADRSDRLDRFPWKKALYMRSMGKFPGKSVRSVRSVRRQGPPLPAPGGLEASPPPPDLLATGFQGGGRDGARLRGERHLARRGWSPLIRWPQRGGKRGMRPGAWGDAKGGRAGANMRQDPHPPEEDIPIPPWGIQDPPGGDPRRTVMYTRDQRRFLRGDTLSPPLNKGSPRAFSRARPRSGFETFVASGASGGGGAVAAHPAARHLPRRAQDPAGGAQPDPTEAKENNVPLIGRP